MAAPMATTSSGLTPLWPSLPKMSLTSHCTFGMRVMPPTMTISSMSDGFSLASASAFSTGPRHCSIRGSTSCSNLARVSDICRCFGPDGVRRDERQVDVGRRLLRQVLLGPLGRFLEPLQGHLVLAQVDAVAPS